jgi:membrane-associated protein
MSSAIVWKVVAAIGVIVGLLATVGVVLSALTNDALGTLDDPSSDTGAYLAVFFFLYGDAVVAIFPGETTLNVASTLASQGELDLGLVILVGSMAAWLGDNTLYWIARSIPAVRKKARDAQEDDRFKNALQLVGRHARLLVVFCRFLPFVRWAVTAGMGALPMPYRGYALWSAVGAVGWTTYTCLVAYFIGTALDEFPVASIVISCVSSTILIGAILLVERWRRRASVTTVGTA